MNHKVKGKKPSKKAVRRIKRELEALCQNPRGLTGDDLASFALRLGRKRKNRGKEPNYVREDDPELSPPLSIPQHGSTSLKQGTARSILFHLLSDCDGWEIYFAEQNGEDDEREDDEENDDNEDDND